ESVDVTRSVTLVGGAPRVFPLEQGGPSIIDGGFHIIPLDHVSRSIVFKPTSTGFILDADNITVKNFTIQKEADGIRSNGAFSGFKIQSNTFLNDTVGVHLNTVLTASAKTTTISDNRFTNDGSTAASQDAILVDKAGASKVVITSNTILRGV